MLDFITINEQSSIRVDEGKIIYSDPYNINCAPHDADIKATPHKARLTALCGVAYIICRQNNVIFRFYCRYVVYCNRIG